MAFYLTDLLQMTLRKLGVLQVSVATGGSGTTVTDTKFNEVFLDNEFQGGTVFIVYDSAGSGGSPEGKFGYITSQDGSTFSLTFADMTDAVASGDTYAFADPVFPLYQMIELANDTVKELGDIPLVDTTTLDTASAQTEYTCQTVWKRKNGPSRIDIQTNTSDANDNRWQELPRDRWEFIPATAGSTGLIVFRDQLPVSRDVRIWYEDKHPRLTAYNSEIWEGHDPETVAKVLTQKVLEWYNAANEGSDRYRLEHEDKLASQVQVARLENAPVKPQRKNKLLIIGGYQEEDTFTVPGPA